MTPNTSAGDFTFRVLLSESLGTLPMSVSIHGSLVKRFSGLPLIEFIVMFVFVYLFINFHLLLYFLVALRLQVILAFFAILPYALCRRSSLELLCNRYSSLHSSFFFKW